MNAAGAAILPLRAQRLGYRVGATALLDQLSFRLEAGARTVLLGPNGAGKSLLLRLCHGLIEPSSGALQWAEGADRAALRRAQAMVFQRPVLLRRSVEANVRYALAAHGVRWRDRGALTRAALTQVHLGELAKRPAQVLSGGEQQRLALARVWALRPQLLLLDEPTANLDPGAARRVEQIVDALYRRGTTLLMSTHDLGQARRHADRVLFLHRGRLLEDRSAVAFFRRPESAAARAFLAGDLLD